MALELNEARVVFASNAVYWQKTVRTACGVPVHFLLVPLDPVLLYVHRNILGTGEPRTATSTFARLLSSECLQR